MQVGFKKHALNYKHTHASTGMFHFHSSTSFNFNANIFSLISI